MAHPYKSQCDASQSRILKSYGCGGEVAAKAVHQHESNMHAGKRQTPIKLATGGKVPGKAAGGRLDKFARGGRSKGGSGRVNVIIQTGGGEGERQMAMKQGLQLGAMAGRGAPPPGGPPRPPPVPPGAGGAPPGVMPPGMMPPGMMPPGGMPPGGMAPGAPPPRPPMARGGRAYPLSGSAGSGGGKGRLEKHHGYADGGTVAVKAHSRRKAGGRVP